MKSILVTGGAGFIGSNFIRYMLSKYKDCKIINLDALTYAGNLKNLEEVSDNINYVFVHMNICNRKGLEKVFKEYSIDYVVNFAAESHVDRSIEQPEIFLQTNIIGTQMLLDTAKHHWKIQPNDKYCTDYKDGVKFLQISTDEVYGSLIHEGKFAYSASKASADMIVRAYKETYKMPINITRCSNNYGPYQFPEKLIPLMISNCKNSKDLPVYGDGMQIRDWLHVEDHCSAIDTVLHKGENGQIYNIGGDNEKTNIEIVRLIIDKLGKSQDLIKYVKDRLGHDKRYAIDNTKITSGLGWRPSYTFEQGINETIDWYLNNTDWVEDIINGEHKNYYKNMYGEIS